MLRIVLLVASLSGLGEARALDAHYEPSCRWEEDAGGWNSCVADAWLLSERCNIDRVSLEQLSLRDFAAQYLERRPVILEGSKQVQLAAATRKAVLLAAHGAERVTLSAANTNSHTKRVETFADYLQGLSPHDPGARGNETYYLFGPHSELSRALAPLVELYVPPPLTGDGLAMSFGIGASASGVPFHVHGHGFSEVIHGRKRWLLYPPAHRPPFDPDASSALWLRDTLPALVGRDAQLLRDCTIGPGELLYFPSMWWHAVVNVGETVFVSAFADTRGGAAAQHGSARPLHPFY